MVPKLAGEGRQCPSAPECPTLQDQLHFCGALMGFAASFAFQGGPSDPPVTTLVPQSCGIPLHFASELLLSPIPSFPGP